MEFFKGYVETKDKQSIEKFKGRTKFKSYDEVKHLDEFAGILDERTILIDIDDFEQSEILLDIVDDLQLRCRVYETTRGKHFVFINTDVSKCATHTKLACGLVADIKVGVKNSYEVLKYNGKEREIIYDKLDDEDYQELPKWLKPIKTKQDFLDMSDGDGRNQALFNYILTLQSNGFTVDEAKECIEIINKYILKKSLSKSELEVILREESFAKPTFFKDKVFLFDEFAKYMKNTLNIIKIDNQLHIYRDGVYVNGSIGIEAEMIKLIPNLNKAKRSEVMSYLELLILENTDRSDAKFIAFKNGVYDIEKDEFIDFNPRMVITNKINHNYNPRAYSEIVDKTLDKLACHDKEIRSLLEEAFGYTFYRRNELRKAFVLTGEKHNGKSTYLDMILNVLGGENTSAVDLGELGDRFKTAMLFGMLANIGDDIGDEFIVNPAIFKKLVSGDRVNVEFKGKDPFDFSSYAKLLFSANNMPRIKDRTGAVIDRLIMIPFNAKFTSQDPDFDPYIKYKLRQDEAVEYFITLGIKGLKRVLTNQGFTTSEVVEKELEAYNEDNNPILLFFKELNATDIENQPTKDVYARYSLFCSENGFTAMSNIEFSKQVKSYFEVEIINKSIKGTKYRIFTKTLK